MEGDLQSRRARLSEAEATKESGRGAGDCGVLTKGKKVSPGLTGRGQGTRTSNKGQAAGKQKEAETTGFLNLRLQVSNGSHQQALIRNYTGIWKGHCEQRHR